MNIKKTVKKIAALGTGAGMIGMTLMGALAVAPDLQNFPGFMVDDGAFDGRIVVGANAAAEDILGSIDVAAALGASASANTGSGSGPTTSVSGDAAQIGESSDILEIGESIGSVVESLAEDDLLMLAGGRVTTSKGSTSFSQTLELDGDTTPFNGQVGLFENRDDVVDFFLKFEDGLEAFTYELEFTSGLESDLDADDIAEDLEDESIFMLGQYYSIVSAVSDGTDLTLELIAGDVVDTLTEGQTKVYTVDGTDYEVTVLVIGTSSSTSTVKFLINGEVSDSMEPGDTDTLSDGLEIGVREIIETTAYREGDPGSVVEFYLGANKIEFTTTASGAAGDVEINRENIEDATVVLSYTATANDNIRLNNIRYTLESDAARGTDIFIGEGEGLRQHLDEPEGMLNAEWDIIFEGLTNPEMTDIEFDPQGDDEYNLEFTNRKGQTYRVPYVTTDGTVPKFGDSDDDFVFWENDAGENVTAASFPISEDDYFLLTDDAGSNQGDSYVFQWDDIDVDDQTLSFSNLATGDNKEVQFDITEVLSPTDILDVTTLVDGNKAGDINVAGNDFGFWLLNTTGVYTMAVDIDNSGSIASGDVPITVKGGGILDLFDGGANPNAYNGTALTNGYVWGATLTSLGDDVDNDVDQTFGWNFTDATTTIDVSLDTNTSGVFFEEDDNDLDVTYATTGYGIWVEITSDSDDSDSLVISYPASQREALVYVVGGNVERSISGGTGGSVSFSVSSVGLALLDTEVDVDDTNLIVIGGPCANSIAADLLGNPADCAEGFTPGMGMIRTFDTGDNVAVLAAGATARDTVQTSQVLAEKISGAGKAGLTGTSVEVVIAGSNDVSVRQAMVDDSMDETA